MARNHGLRTFLLNMQQSIRNMVTSFLKSVMNLQECSGILAAEMIFILIAKKLPVLFVIVGVTH